MSIKPTIAIACNFPVWEIASDLPRPGPHHYAVWLSALANSLSDQSEYDIHWVVLSRLVSKRKIVENLGQFFHILPRCRKTIGLYTRYLYDRWRVSSELARIQPDIAHFWGTEDCYALCGKDYKGCKILSIQGLLNAYIQRGRMSSFEVKHSTFEYPAVRSFDYLTTESPWAAERIREFASPRCIFHFEYAVEEQFFKKKRSLTSHPTCLYAGTDAPIKNVDTLIRAFSSPELAHIQLILAGISPQTRASLPANITALGRVDRNTIAELLSTSWVLVHPSKADTGPTIVKEARVVGLPVVISTECGCKQYITHSKNGYIIEPNDTQSLIRAVLDLTTSKERNLSAGEYEQKECRQALSCETMRNRLVQIYSSLLPHTKDR